MPHRTKPWSLIPTIVLTIAVIAGIYYWQAQSVGDVAPEQTETETEEEETTVPPEEVVTYEWESQGISFEYPATHHVLVQDDNSIFITTATGFTDDDQMTFWTKVTIDSRTTLDERVNEYGHEAVFQQSTVTIGNYEFVKVDLRSLNDGADYSRYLLEVDGKLVDYRVGKDDAELALAVLGSLQL